MRSSVWAGVAFAALLLREPLTPTLVAAAGNPNAKEELLKEDDLPEGYGA